MFSAPVLSAVDAKLDGVGAGDTWKDMIARCQTSAYFVKGTRRLSTTSIPEGHTYANST
jgi:hypothetical protein